MSSVQNALSEALGPGRLAGVDEAILEYVGGVLEDDGFEWGDSPENALEAVGALLARDCSHKRPPSSCSARSARRGGGRRRLRHRQRASCLTKQLPLLAPSPHRPITD